MEKNWDARDMSQPFTVVGVLSEAIFMEHDLGPSYGVLDRVIKELLDNPEEYRWT